MKLIVETKGSIQVVFPGPDNHAHHDRPSVVNPSQLMQIKIGSGELVVLGQVNDGATDVEFAKAWAEVGDDHDLAIQAFIAEYPVEVEEREPTAAEKKEAKAAAAAAKAAEEKKQA
jgi:hypothetical protein